MRHVTFVSILALATLAFPSSVACTQGAPYEGPLGTVTIGSGAAGSGSYYIVDRNYVTGDGIWLYHESNGADGVQTGGCSVYIANDCDWWYDGSRCPPAGYVADRLIL